MSFNVANVIFFDFDGVILNSNSIKEASFRQCLESYDSVHVDAFTHYHRAHGGVSRYVKFRHFFEKILEQKVDEVVLHELCQKFSELVCRELLNPDHLIGDTLTFLKEVHTSVPCHVVSGADQDELRYLCTALELSQYFVTVNGSPRFKEEILKSLISEFGYSAQQALMIGDSMTDLEAAQAVGVPFWGYNNEALVGFGSDYIDSFQHLLQV